MRYLVRFALIVVLSLPAKLVLAASPSVVISELQTGTTANASQEFVELYNPTSSDVALDNWKLEYKSATSAVQASSWSKRAGLAGTIKSHGFYLIAPKAYFSNADADLSAGLAGSGGHVRLVDGSGNVIDLLGWGDPSNAAETKPAPAPAAGQSLERLPGRLDSASGNSTDTDDNSKDFLLRTDPEPQTTASPIEIPSMASTPPDSDATPPAGATGTDQPPIDDPGPVAQSYPVININELLVNPAAPLTDANDEYIELFNPGDTAANLEGYVLQTGSSFHDHYTIPATAIPAGGYLSLYSSETNLSLTNTGGAARLLDPLGNTISQTSDYSSAPEGQSWSHFDSGWQWTLQLTPGRPNVMVQPVAPSGATNQPQTTSNAKATVKKAQANTSTKTTSTKATATPKATKTSQPKSTKSAPKAISASNIDATSKGAALPAKWLLLAALGLTIGYGIYEFRHDLQNYYYLARRKLKARP